MEVKHLMRSVGKEVAGVTQGVQGVLTATCLTLKEDELADV